MNIFITQIITNETLNSEFYLPAFSFFFLPKPGRHAEMQAFII